MKHNVKNLKIACTGDSRAVWGYVDGSGDWVARQLSLDQTGGTPSEMQRLRKEHPGEEKTVVSRGRILGNLEPSRAFGDFKYKLPWKTQEKIYDALDATVRLPPNFATPPYVTAEPLIQTIDTTPGGFIVLATDGLWEKLSNQQVVSLVAAWMDSRGLMNSTNKSGWISDWMSKKRAHSLPSVKDYAPVDPVQNFPRVQLNVADVRSDPNAATMLIRNALGGESYILTPGVC